MISTVTKLRTYATYVGHCRSKAPVRFDCPTRSGARGTLMSSTSSVMAIEKTPSLNASSRPVSFSPSYSPVLVTLTIKRYHIGHGIHENHTQRSAGGVGRGSPGRAANRRPAEHYSHRRGYLERPLSRLLRQQRNPH